MEEGVLGRFEKMRTPDRESSQVFSTEVGNRKVPEASNLMRRPDQRTGTQPHPPA